MIERHFGFLVEEYGFSQSGNTFTSESLNLEIRILIEREPPGTYYPGLFFKLADEPDSPVLPLDWILYYFDTEEPQTWLEGGSLEENARFVAQLVGNYGPRLLRGADQWWLPAHKYRLEIWETRHHTSHSVTFDHIYEYLRGKEAGNST